MARSRQMSVQKRMREQKKAERAAQKRESRTDAPRAARATDVASAAELESYGLPSAPFDDEAQRD